MIEANNIYNIDCLSAMRTMESGSVDLIATDPPYRICPRGVSSCTMGGYWKSEQARKGKIFDNNDIDIKDYIGEFYRILKDDAHCYIFCNNYNLPYFFEVISNSDFKFVKLLVWDKQIKICGRYYMGQIEHIFLLRKGKDKPINDCGCSDFLSFPRERKSAHESAKPIALMQCLIGNSTNENEVVLDPFMGGSTAIACIRAKRKYIGFEIDKKYYDIATNKINLEKSNLTFDF